MVIKINHAIYIFLKNFPAKIIHPCISASFNSTGTHGKYSRFFFIVERYKITESSVTLIDPVVMVVGLQNSPGQGSVVAKGGNLCQLAFPCQIVAYVVIADDGLAVVSGLFHQQGDGNGRAGTGAKNLAAFLAGEFAGGTLIAAQIEHIDGGKFPLQLMAEAVRRIAVQPCPIGDETEDAFRADTIRSPAEGPNIRIIEAIFISC